MLDEKKKPDTNIGVIEGEHNNFVPYSIKHEIDLLVMGLSHTHRLKPRHATSWYEL